MALDEYTAEVERINGEAIWHGITPADLFATRANDAPRFNADHFPDAISRPAVMLGEVIGVDPVIPATAGLAACVAVLSDAHVLQVKRHDPDWVEAPRLWLNVIAGPAHKKSPGSRRMLKPVYALQKRRYQEWCEAMEAHKASDEPKDTAPKLDRYLVGDATVEALSEVLAQNTHGVLAAFDEMSSFFGGMDAYRQRGESKDRGWWLQAYEGGPYIQDRVIRGNKFIPNLSVAIYGHIQPEHIQRIAKGLRDDGLLQRFVVLTPRPGSEDEDIPIDGSVMGRYDAMLDELLNLPITSTLYRLKADAQDALTAARRRALQLSRLPVYDARQKTWLAKSGAHLARLVMLYHLIERRGEIMRGYNMGVDDLSDGPGRRVSLSTVERASAFYFEYLLPAATTFYRVILGTTEQMHDAMWVAGHILAREKAHITARDIARAYRNLRPGKGEEYDGIREVMEVLELAGWVLPHEGAGYKAATRWDVHPEVRTRFASRMQEERDKRAAIRAELAKLKH